MYKILISDFEDTLIDNEDAIPLSTMLSLDKMRTYSIPFVVMTNKSLKSILEYNKDFPFVDYIICMDGAYVYDAKESKALIHKNIGVSIIKKIKKNFDQFNLCFYTLDWCNYTKKEINKENQRKIGDFNVFSKFHKDNIFKIEIHTSSKKEQVSIMSQLEEMNLDIQVQAKKEKDYFVEVFMKGCSRLQAVDKICNKNHISLQEVVFIGANENNLDSYTKVGMPIAVDNANKKLKKASIEVTVSNNEKAVELAIKKYLDDFPSNVKKDKETKKK